MQKKIIKPDPDDELAADRLKNAAATKKLAIFDRLKYWLELKRKKHIRENNSNDKTKSLQGFAERRSK